MIQIYLKFGILRSHVHIFLLYVLGTFMVYIVKHHALYFVGNIYVVVTMKINERSGDHWL